MSETSSGNPVNIGSGPFVEWLVKVYGAGTATGGPLQLRDLNPWFLERGRTDFLTLRNQCRGKVIAVANLKGGVGKSSLTANLGAALADRGKRVLLLDLDWQESLTRLTLTIDEASYVQKGPPPLLAQAFQNYAATPRVANWGQLIPRAEGIKVRRKCLNGGSLVVLPTTSDLQIAEEIALMSHFWNAKTDAWNVSEAARFAKGIYDSRFIAAEMICLWGSEFDHVIADCPPRLTTSSVGALAAADLILMPAQQDPVALNGVTLFLNKFLPRFTDVLWAGRSALPSFLVVMNLVHHSATRLAIRTVTEFVKDFEDRERLRLSASKAIIPHYAGFRHAAEDRSKDVRRMALDEKGSARLRQGLTTLLGEIDPQLIP